MPDNKDKQQKNQPLPSKGYSIFKQRFNEPSDIYEGKSNQQVINENAELIYYAKKLNQELRKKDPQNYDSLIKEYGYNPQNPLYPKERIKGAEKYIKGEEGKNFNKSLTIEEQQKILGNAWNRYVQLKKSYGSGLNMFGENEDPNKPETWRIGARHAVAANPVAGQRTAVKDKNVLIGDYARTVTYDPTQKNPYIVSDINYSQEAPQNVRTVKYYAREYDNAKTSTTANGKVWKEPGLKFYKVYDDGTKQEVDDVEYINWLGYNNAPANIKRAIGTEKIDTVKLTPEEQEARIRAFSRQDLTEEL